MLRIFHIPRSIYSQSEQTVSIDPSFLNIVKYIFLKLLFLNQKFALQT